MSPLIFAVSGKARHGKDTISDYLVEKYGFKKFTLAEPIKEICRTVFTFSDNQLYGDLKDVVDDRWSVSPRQCFQFIGTELFREQIGKLLPECGNSIWTKCLIEKIKLHIIDNPMALIVISDVRFENEWTEFSKLFDGCYCIRVNNPRVKTVSEHVSEKMAWSCDIHIENDGTISDLFKKVDSLVENLAYVKDNTNT